MGGARGGTSRRSWLLLAAFDRSGGGPLVAALAAGATLVDAARQAGVSERTVRRRLDDPAFCQQVDEARAAMLTQAVARLTAASVAAVETLQTLLAAEPAFVRLAAARAILDLGLKYREHHDLTERVLALELAAEAPPSTGRQR